nr:hypothetical protein [uncultured Halomonas sp.]
MKVTEKVEVDAVTDVRCDVCLTSTQSKNGGLEFATLQAHWGYGSQHDGERYEVHLCEDCFFSTLAYFNVQNLFSEEGDAGLKAGDIGLGAKDDFFRDNGRDTRQ